MQIKRNILSTLLLMILLIGSGALFAQNMNRCCEPTHSKNERHHDCCHCEIHVDICSSHRFALDHRCSVGENKPLEYINSDQQKRRGANSSQLSSGAQLTASLQRGFGISVTPPILALSRLIEAWQDDEPRGAYHPSTDSLRAPPALV